MTMSPDEQKAAILDAALPHVAFDGWSETTFRAAVDTTGIPMADARALFPRGAVDLALHFHKLGDDAMAVKMREADLSDMRYRDKVAAAVRYRIEAIEDKEAVRRAAALFALPHHAGDSARALWGTADRIWTALGDTSDDLNWYSKRATLSGVYAATLLYWLGDDSYENADTWAFLDRRIDDVMQIEKAKAQARKLPGVGQLMEMPNRLFGRVRRPGRDPRAMPGHFNSQPTESQ